MSARAPRISACIAAITIAAVGIAPLLAGQRDTDFRETVAPILSTRCVRCHNAERHEGGLALDSKEGLLAGGDSGPVIQSGDAEASFLVEQVSALGGKPAMPKGGRPLAEQEVEAIRNWIASGADWPEGLTLSERPGKNDAWWSLKPIERPSTPAVDGPDAAWARTPIDAFVLAGLRANGLQPSPEADRRTLIRRVYFDLIGLPPTFDEVESFASDESPDAYEKLVDRALDSPRYGERWARHWLDVVHYGDTDDFGRDYLRPNAWPYRDYVVRSFNEDKPYHQFVEEQLAGDFLYPESPDGVTATGFIVAGPWDYTGHVLLFDDAREKQVTRYLDRDDMVTNAMSTFTSLTVHCARCHDHKFDPITQDDYYSLQAVFAGVNRADRPRDARIAYDPSYRWWVLPGLISGIMAIAVVTLSRPAVWIGHRLLFRKVGKHRLRVIGAAVIACMVTVLWGLWLSDYRDLPVRAERKLEGLLGLKYPFRYDRRYAEAPKVFAATSIFPKIDTRTGTYGPTADGKPRLVEVLQRGNVDAPLRVASPGAVACVEALESKFRFDDPEDEGQRRAALAHWIVTDRNPLTWRSIVNRVWHYHFGTGIVDTPNDFGRMGSLPSNPALLDWLAAEFRDGRQSLKALHRLIITSAVYRQSSLQREDAAAIDSQNRLLWRMNRRHLEAEAIRDSVLCVSGSLDLAMYGPGFQTFVIENPNADVMQFLYDQHDPDDPRSLRRTVYRFIARSVSDPFLETLDCAAPSQNVPVRTETNTALQALALLNNAFIVRQSEHLAARVAAATANPAAQVMALYQFALGRDPAADEQHAMVEYLSQYGLPSACRLLFNLNEFTFVD